MVNSGSYKDRNEKAALTQPSANGVCDDLSSSVMAPGLTQCKADSKQTADVVLPSASAAIEPKMSTDALPQHQDAEVCEEVSNSSPVVVEDEAEEKVPSVSVTKAETDAESKMKQIPSRKLLCLYCDRTFVSANLRQKHVERCHSAKQTRRVSPRQLLTATPCTHCDKLNNSEHTLKDLFLHLTNEHSNKYYACTACEERFLSSTQLTEHNASKHPKSVSTPPSELPTCSKLIPKVDHLIQEEPIPQKLTRSRLKTQTSPADQTNKRLLTTTKKSIKLKKFAVRTSRIALKRSKRLQAKLPAETTKLRRKPTERKPITDATASTSTKTADKPNKTTSSCINPYPEFDSFFRVKKITDHSIDNLKISSLTFDDVFDKAFFNRIKCNIQENLLHHIDGKLFKNEESDARISNFEKTPQVQQEVQNSSSENYGCDLSLNAATPVAALSLNSQFGEDFESQIEYGSKPSKKKNQTKSKDEVHYKYFTRRKYQASILEHKENRDLSKLDMWTQLVIKERQQRIVDRRKSAKEMLEYTNGDEFKMKVRKEELNRILDRRGPFEDLREEANKKAALDKLNSGSEESISQETFSEVREVLNEVLNKVYSMCDVVSVKDEDVNSASKESDVREIPSYLNLRSTSSLPVEGDVDKSDRIALICSSQETENFELPTNRVRGKNELVELTGEWARTRMYICAACGKKLPNIKMLYEHKSFYHQNVWAQHYELVGNQNELYRHLSIPGLGKVGVIEDSVQCKLWKRSDARVCTKCGKQCNALGELHRHVLECGGDWTWMLARKKCKYRPFGAKSRRKRRGLVKRHHHINKTDQPTEKKIYKKAFDGPRQKPSDADTIQRMLANLPAKRSTRKIMSLQDGFRTRRPRENNVQNKLKCGKLIYKNVNKSEASPRNVRNIKRNFSAVLSSRLIDTNSTLRAKRILKNLANKRVTRQNKGLLEEVKSVEEEVVVEEPVSPKRKKNTKNKENLDGIVEDQEPVKRVLREKSVSPPQVKKKMTVKKILTGKINIKSFFPVKKKKKEGETVGRVTRQSKEVLVIGEAEEETEKSGEIEGEIKKGGNNKKGLVSNLVRTLTMKKKKKKVETTEVTEAVKEPQSEDKKVEEPVVVEKTSKKRKFKRSFRNVVNKVKKLKVEPPVIVQNEVPPEPEKLTQLNVPNSFLEEPYPMGTSLEKIVAPSILEKNENIVDSITDAPTVISCMENDLVPETMFNLETSNEKSLQAKGEHSELPDVVEEKQTVVETETKDIPTVVVTDETDKTCPISIETSSKCSNSPLISPSLMSPTLSKKIRKPGKGLNDCIAMLTSKLQQKTDKKTELKIAEKPIVPKLIEKPTVQKPECILKIPTFKSQITEPMEQALDLTKKSSESLHSPNFEKKSATDNDSIMSRSCENLSQPQLNFVNLLPRPLFSFPNLLMHPNFLYQDPFELHRLRALSNLDLVIENVVEKSRVSSHIDNIIQQVVEDSCQKTSSLPNINRFSTKNSVDDIIEYVIKAYKSDETDINVLNSIESQLNDRKIGAVRKKPGKTVIPDELNTGFVEPSIEVANPGKTGRKIGEPRKRTAKKKKKVVTKTEVAKVEEKQFLETDVDNLLNTNEVAVKPETSSSTTIVTDAIIEGEGAVTVEMVNEDEPHLLENKIVAQADSDSDDDIPLAIFAKTDVKISQPKGRGTRNSRKLSGEEIMEIKPPTRRRRKSRAKVVDETSKVVDTSDVETSKVVETSDVETSKAVETSDVETSKPVETSDVETSKAVETSVVETSKVVETSDVETKIVETSAVVETDPEPKTLEDEKNATTDVEDPTTPNEDVAEELPKEDEDLVTQEPENVKTPTTTPKLIKRRGRKRRSRKPTPTTKTATPQDTTILDDSTVEETEPETSIVTPETSMVTPETTLITSETSTVTPETAEVQTSTTIEQTDNPETKESDPIPEERKPEAPIKIQIKRKSRNRLSSVIVTDSETNQETSVAMTTEEPKIAEPQETLPETDEESLKQPLNTETPEEPKDLGTTEETPTNNQEEPKKRGKRRKKRSLPDVVVDTIPKTNEEDTSTAETEEIEEPKLITKITRKSISEYVVSEENTEPEKPDEAPNEDQEKITKKRRDLEINPQTTTDLDNPSKIPKLIVKKRKFDHENYFVETLPENKESVYDFESSSSSEPLTKPDLEPIIGVPRPKQRKGRRRRNANNNKLKKPPNEDLSTEPSNDEEIKIAEQPEDEKTKDKLKNLEIYNFEEDLEGPATEPTRKRRSKTKKIEDLNTEVLPDNLDVTKKKGRKSRTSVTSETEELIEEQNKVIEPDATTLVTEESTSQLDVETEESIEDQNKTDNQDSHEITEKDRIEEPKSTTLETEDQCITDINLEDSNIEEPILQLDDSFEVDKTAGTEESTEDQNKTGNQEIHDHKLIEEQNMNESEIDTPETVKRGRKSQEPIEEYKFTEDNSEILKKKGRKSRTVVSEESIPQLDDRLGESISELEINNQYSKEIQKKKGRKSRTVVSEEFIAQLDDKLEESIAEPVINNQDSTEILKKKGRRSRTLDTEESITQSDDLQNKITRKGRKSRTLITLETEESIEEQNKITEPEVNSQEIDTKVLQNTEESIEDEDTTLLTRNSDSQEIPKKGRKSRTLENLNSTEIEMNTYGAEELADDKLKISSLGIDNQIVPKKGRKSRTLKTEESIEKIALLADKPGNLQVEEQTEIAKKSEESLEEQNKITEALIVNLQSQEMAKKKGRKSRTVDIEESMVQQTEPEIFNQDGQEISQQGRKSTSVIAEESFEDKTCDNPDSQEIVKKKGRNVARKKGRKSRTSELIEDQNPVINNLENPEVEMKTDESKEAITQLPEELASSEIISEFAMKKAEEPIVEEQLTINNPDSQETVKKKGRKSRTFGTELNVAKKKGRKSRTSELIEEQNTITPVINDLESPEPESEEAITHLVDDQLKITEADKSIELDEEVNNINNLEGRKSRMFSMDKNDDVYRFELETEELIAQLDDYQNKLNQVADETTNNEDVMDYEQSKVQNSRKKGRKSKTEEMILRLDNKPEIDQEITKKKGRKSRTTVKDYTALETDLDDRMKKKGRKSRKDQNEDLDQLQLEAGEQDIESDAEEISLKLDDEPELDQEVTKKGCEESETEEMSLRLDDEPEIDQEVTNEPTKKKDSKFKIQNEDITQLPNDLNEDLDQEKRKNRRKKLEIEPLIPDLPKPRASKIKAVEKIFKATEEEEETEETVKPNLTHSVEDILRDPPKIDSQDVEVIDDIVAVETINDDDDDVTIVGSNLKSKKFKPQSEILEELAALMPSTDENAETRRKLKRKSKASKKILNKQLDDDLFKDFTLVIKSSKRKLRPDFVASVPVEAEKTELQVSDDDDVDDCDGFGESFDMVDMELDDEIPSNNTIIEREVPIEPLRINHQLMGMQSPGNVPSDEDEREKAKIVAEAIRRSNMALKVSKEIPHMPHDDVDDLTVPNLVGSADNIRIEDNTIEEDRIEDNSIEEHRIEDNTTNINTNQEKPKFDFNKYYEEKMNEQKRKARKKSKSKTYDIQEIAELTEEVRDVVVPQKDVYDFDDDLDETPVKMVEEGTTIKKNDNDPDLNVEESDVSLKKKQAKKPRQSRKSLSLLDTQDVDSLPEPSEEVRRSRRCSKKIASYNENELLDPILDAIERDKKRHEKSTDELFDMLKATAPEIPPKPQAPTLDPYDDTSEDFTDDKFDNVFDNMIETSLAVIAKNKPENLDKIYDFTDETKTDSNSKPSNDSPPATPEIRETPESRKQKPKPKSQDNYCEICKKSFIRSENLIKHKRTLTHISKLSEIEAKEAEERAKQQQESSSSESKIDDEPETKLEDDQSKLDDEQESKLDDEQENKLDDESEQEPSPNLADIINDVIAEPILEERETRPYKSLAERKSFEEDKDFYEPTLSKTTILEKQISLLQNIIENQTGMTYIDDISMSSNVTSPSEDTKTEKESFLKPTQYEEISEDSTTVRTYDDPKLRKALNRDEELFLECCSLLKSGSEVSNYSKKSNKASDIIMKQADEPNWLENKSLSKDVEYSDNFRIPTPLGDNIMDDASNSNTISSNWNVNVTEKDEEKSFSFEEVLGKEEEKQKSGLSRFGGMLTKTIKNQINNIANKIRKPVDERSDSSECKKSDDLSDCSTNDSKKMMTKGAMKVFEGLKVSIPTEELNLEEVLNCSPQAKKIEDKEAPLSPSKRNARKSKPVKNKSQEGSKLLFKINKKKAMEKRKGEDMGDQPQHDVYDFEDTQDNLEVLKPDFRLFKAKKDDDTDSVEAVETKSQPARKPKAQQNMTKKKCMIMGRIFKNAMKPKVEEVPESVEVVESEVKETDKVSDSDVTVESNEGKPKGVEMRRKSVKQKQKKRARAHSESTDDEFSITKTTKRRNYNKKNAKPEDNCINLEQELKECIGVASRKSQRKCTSGKQNVLVEYWSSDDSAFEALLESQILETKTVKETPKPVEEVVPEPEPQQTEIKEDTEIVTTEELPSVKVPEKKPVKKPKVQRPKSNNNNKQDSQTAPSNNRRKRAAANPLYHWSSSSEDESNDLIEVKPIRDEIDDDEERPIQHGWIVGDSPKKLVTLLAHAKGKKTDIDCVKEQKKRTNSVS